jgi:hypothetical protein
MVVSLGLAGLALRAGLELRRLRLRRHPSRVELRRRHLRLAKPAVGLIALGALGGPLSAWLLRDWTPFQTFHSWVGVAALATFVVTAVVGRRLERGLTVARPQHARVALLAALLAALAAASGFVLLP